MTFLEVFWAYLLGSSESTLNSSEDFYIELLASFSVKWNLIGYWRSGLYLVCSCIFFGYFQMNFAFPKSRKEGSIRSFLEKPPKWKLFPLRYNTKKQLYQLQKKHRISKQYLHYSSKYIFNFLLKKP